MTSQSSHWDFTIKEWSEPLFMDMLKMAFSKDDIKIVYDIGACVGGWSKVVLDNFNPDKIYCWEPFTRNFLFLYEKMRKEKVQCFSYGIFYGKDFSYAHGYGDMNVGGQFVDGLYENLNIRHSASIFNLLPLESFMIESPDLVKIDVEGSEKNIIENSTILKKTPYLIIEWHYPEDAKSFFDKHLPEHSIISSFGNMFLLKK